MFVYRRLSLLGLVVMMLGPADLVSRATAQCGYGYGGGWYPVSRAYQSRNRLYRHRSGYLYGQYRQFQYGLPYAGGYGDPRVDFDVRRDNLLRAAAQIDVDFVRDERVRPTSGRPARRAPALHAPIVPTTPTSESGGWVHLMDGEPEKALGSFTARLMMRRGDPLALMGHGLAAAALDDTVVAARSMRDAIRIDPAVIADVQTDERMRRYLRGLIARHAEKLDDDAHRADVRFLTATVHCVLREPEEAWAALDTGDDAPPEAGPAALIALRGVITANRTDATERQASADEPSGERPARKILPIVKRRVADAGS